MRSVAEELIKFTKCGYHCREEWIECPICNTTLNTAPLEEDLIT